MQIEAGGIAQVVGHGARASPAATSSSSVLGDNIFEYAEAEAIRGWVDGDDGALIFVKEVPDPERFGVVVYGEDGRVTDVVEKAGVVDMRYDAPPSSDAVVGLYCYPPDVFDADPRARAVVPRRARDHRRQPPLRRAGRARRATASRAGGRTPARTGSTSPRSARSIERTGVNKLA